MKRRGREGRGDGEGKGEGLRGRRDERGRERGTGVWFRIMSNMTGLCVQYAMDIYAKFCAFSSLAISAFSCIFI